MGQTYSYYSNASIPINKDDIENNKNKDTENDISDEKTQNLISDKTPEIIVTDYDKDKELEELVKEYVNKLIDNVVKKLDEESCKDLDNSSNFSSLSDQDNINTDNESDISIEESVDYDDFNLDLNLNLNLKDSVKSEIKEEISLDNKKIRYLECKIEELSDDYDDLFLKYTRLRIKYESLICKKNK